VNVALQSNIYKAQNVMLSMPQAETETRHHFADGIYARELLHSCWRVSGRRIAQDQPSIYVVSQGECVAVTHEGTRRN
jgi:hypothetical protein